METEILGILKKNQLSVTESRRKILELFKLNNGALAHHDIEERTGDRFDRVTIYRTLQTFVEKGIIHTIPSADNSIKYALCKDECTEGHPTDGMVHALAHHEFVLHFQPKASLRTGQITGVEGYLESASIGLVAVTHL